MEAMGDLAAGGTLRWAKLPAGASAVQPPPAVRGRGLYSVAAEIPHPLEAASDSGTSGDLARCLELLRNIGSTAVEDAALLSYRAAADFTDEVEEISRAAEYLQIVAAGAVERSRREAATAARSAAIGAGAVGSGSAGSGAGAPVGWVTGWGAETAETAAASQTPAAAESDPADDGCRNAAEFLRTRLRISIAEARRRLVSPAGDPPGRRARARAG